MGDAGVLVAAISATASVLLAIISLVVQPIILAKLAIASKERSDQGVQLKEIHTLTNSNMTKLSAALDMANAKIGELDRMIAELRSPSGGGGHTASPSLTPRHGASPVVVVVDPVKVADDRVAVATERMAEAAEKSADAAVETVAQTKATT